MKNYRVVSNRRNFIFTLLVLIILLSGFIFPGCGRKTPPEMREKNIETLKPVKNLKYQIKESNIFLQWESNYKKKIDRFDIFMAKQNIKECQGCPVVFERIDSLPSELNQYKKELKKGNRYFFKIKTIGINDIKSKDSETVKIEFE